MSNHPISRHLADFIVNTCLSDVPAQTSAELSDVMKLSLLDWCSVALAGCEEPVSQIVRQVLSAERGEAQAQVFGEPVGFPLRAAAMANGTTSHALDYDDTHFMHVGHTSVVVLSAALAAAQWTGSDGRSLLEASIIGSEVACHVGHWLGRSHYVAGFHQTATAGCFGAVAATARLLQLDQRQTMHALGLATTRTSGLKSQFGTMGKPFNAGMAASNGVEAVQLALAGFESRLDALTCEEGFAATHHAQWTPAAMAATATATPEATPEATPDATPDATPEATPDATPDATPYTTADTTSAAGDSLDALGRHFVFQDVRHKLHACCHGLHACIDALDQLRQLHDLSAMQIDHIDIYTNPRWIGVCDKPAPRTGLEAKFSYGFVSAVVFSELDTAALSTFSDHHCGDRQLQILRDRTYVHADSLLADTASRVSISLKDGRRLAASHDIAARQPLDARRRKVMRKSAILLGQSAMDVLWGCIETLQERRIEELTEAISSAGRLYTYHAANK